MFLPMASNQTLLTLSAMFLLCFYPWPECLNVLTSCCDSADIFINAVHVFRNLFWRICRLFEQILITCLKCSRASFSSSSYSEKMRWGRGCIFMPTSSPEQFLKNNPGTAWFRGKSLLDLIRQLQNNRNQFMQCREFSIMADLSDTE